MKITILTLALNSLSALILIIQSCNKEPGIPVVTTESVTGITAKDAISGGNVTSDGGAEVTSRGLCWDTSVDEYNFRALPGGTRLLIEPWWYEPIYYGYFWASSSDNTLTAYAVSMSYMSAAVVIYDRMPNRNGNSVRCIMD